MRKLAFQFGRTHEKQYSAVTEKNEPFYGLYLEQSSLTRLPYDQINVSLLSFAMTTSSILLTLGCDLSLL